MILYIFDDLAAFRRRCGRAFLVIVLLMLGLAFNKITTSAETILQAPITLDAYWQLVERTHAALEADESTASFADEWRQISAIKSGKSVTPVDFTQLADHLAGITTDDSELPDHDTLLATFANLLENRDHWQPPASTTDADDTNSELADILSRPEFTYRDRGPTLWQRFLRWLFSLLFGSDASFSSANIVAKLIPWIAGLALIWLAWYLLRDVFSSFSAESTLNTSDPANTPLTADDALGRAQSLAESGDHRTAIRYLYLSALLYLDSHGLLRYDRTRTNREYLRSVAKQPQVATILRDVVDQFDRTWYGFEAVNETQYQHYVTRVDELRQLARPKRRRGL